jgi:hypothetical protein
VAQSATALSDESRYYFVSRVLFVSKVFVPFLPAKKQLPGWTLLHAIFDRMSIER